jgi:hypothetical protein
VFLCNLLLSREHHVPLFYTCFHFPTAACCRKFARSIWCLAHWSNPHPPLSCHNISASSPKVVLSLQVIRVGLSSQKIHGYTGTQSARAPDFVLLRLFCRTFVVFSRCAFDALCEKCFTVENSLELQIHFICILQGSQLQREGIVHVEQQVAVHPNI